MRRRNENCRDDGRGVGSQVGRVDTAVRQLGPGGTADACVDSEMARRGKGSCIHVKKVQADASKKRRGRRVGRPSQQEEEEGTG